MNQIWGGRTENSIPSHVSVAQGGLPPLVTAHNHDWTFPTWEHQVKVIDIFCLNFFYFIILKKIFFGQMNTLVIYCNFYLNLSLNYFLIC